MIFIHRLGIDWALALGVPLFIQKQKYPTKMAWFGLKALVHFLLTKLPAPKSDIWDIVFFKSIFRTDYDRFFDHVVNCASGNVLVYEARYRWGLNFLGLGLFVKELPVAVRILRHFRFRPFASLYLFVNYLRCIQAITLFRDLQTKVFVSFADMQPLDNSLIQYFNAGRKIATATLQHGLYIDTTSDPSQINTLNFRNVVAKNFLAWGSVTAQLVQRFNQANLPVVGKPFLSFKNEEIYDQSSNFFLIILDSISMHAYNDRLLEMGAQINSITGLEYRVRPHPDLPAGIIQDLPLHTSSSRYRFVIGHSTTLLIELAATGVPVFRMQSDTPYHPHLESFEFSTVEELIAKLSDEIDFKSMVSHLISCTGSESKSKYKETFAKLIEGS